MEYYKSYFAVYENQELVKVLERDNKTKTLEDVTDRFELNGEYKNETKI